MGGLFNRAMKMRILLDKEEQEKKRKQELWSGINKEEIEEEAFSISDEETEEIITEINRLTERKNLRHDKNKFKFKAEKSALALPVLINILSIVAVAAVFFLFPYIMNFQQKQRQIDKKMADTSGSRLLSQLKKESDKEMKAKEEEIERIRQEMALLDKQKQDLESNLANKLQQKKEELQRQLKSKLEEERRKLQAQGYSEEEVERRLNQWRKKEEARRQTEIAAYQRRLEEEKAAAQQRIARQKTQFETSLGQVQQEKQKLQAEFSAKESQLRQELAEEKKALESERSKTVKELDQARERMKELNRQRGEAQAFINHISAQFLQIKDLIQQEKYRQAQENINNLRNYFNKDELQNLEAIKERRSLDLFFIDFLNDYVLRELKMQQDNSSILARMEILNDMEAKAQQAAVLLKSGEKEKAENRYQQALSRLPFVREAHQYFIRKSQGKEEERIAVLLSDLNRAAELFDQNQLTESKAAYQKALGFLPVKPARIQQLIQEVSEIINQEKNSQRLAAVQQRSRILFENGNSFLSKGMYQEAFQSYLAVLSDYQPNTYTQRALLGVNRAVEASRKLVLAEYDKQISDLKEQRQSEIAALEQKKQQEIESLKQDHQQALALLKNDQNAGTKELVSSYEKQIEEIQQAAKDETAQLKEEYEEKIQQLEDKQQEQIASLNEQLGNEGKGALAAKQKEFDDYQEQAKAEIAQLEKEAAEYKEAKEKELSELKSRFFAYQEQIEEKLAGLRKEYDDYRKKVEQGLIVSGKKEGLSEEERKQKLALEKELAEIKEKQQDNILKIRALEKELGQKTELLAKQEPYVEAYTEISELYQKYRDDEDRLFSDDSKLLQAKFRLDRFLQSDAVDTILPGFYRRLRKYDLAFENAGRKEAINDFRELVLGLSRFRNKTERLLYLNNAQGTVLDNEDMDPIIDVLSRLISSG